MENTTINTFLYHGTTTEGPFEKLVDITSYPELFSAPDKIDVSTMSSRQKKYAPGMMDIPDQEFGYIYDQVAFKKIKGMENDPEHFFQLRFGENGEYGAWQWKGEVFTTVSGGSVGSAREAKLITYPSTDIKEVVIA